MTSPVATVHDIVADPELVGTAAQTLAALHAHSRCPIVQRNPRDHGSRAGWSALSASEPDRTLAPEHTRSTQPSTLDMKWLRSGKLSAPTESVIQSMIMMSGRSPAW